MTEKQYKGIAGNFLICDVQKEYAEHLLSILVKRFGMRFQFHFFSNVKKIEQFAEKAEIEILLIAEDCVSEIRGNVKAKKKFILSESMKKEEKQGETTIFRYQSADEILKIIQSGIGEEEAKAAHKPQKKTEEKYDAVQSDFTAPKRKIGIRDEPEESGLIGIYSPIHRIGKTEFALCLGEKISEKVPTLYINMEGYSGNDFYFKGEKNQDLGDLLYYLKQLILLAWAAGEGVIDIRSLLSGNKVPLVKTSDNWQLTLASLFTLGIGDDGISGADAEEGITYKEYLRAFLFLQPEEETTMRTIDRIEENMRLEQNCEKFRADHCVTKCEIRNKVEIFGDLAYTFPSYYGYE